MKHFVRRLSLVFAAGALGGLANALAIWGGGELGITGAMRVQIGPDLTPGLIYPKVVWGGIWGLLFLLPVWRTSVWRRGFVYSLGPTLVQLLIVFPFQARVDWLGLDLGTLTPLCVLIFNAVWGIVAAAWLNGASDR